MLTIAVRHGFPKHNRYPEDPGLADTGENQNLIAKASGLIVARLVEGSQVRIVTSRPKRAQQTGQALGEYPALQPFVVGDMIVSHNLDEGALRNFSEYDRSWKWQAVIHDLGTTAFTGAETTDPALILVTHDSVIRQLANLNGQVTIDVNPLGVNCFTFFKAQG